MRPWRAAVFAAGGGKGARATAQDQRKSNEVKSGGAEERVKAAEDRGRGLFGKRAQGYGNLVLVRQPRLRHGIAMRVDCWERGEPSARADMQIGSIGRSGVAQSLRDRRISPVTASILNGA